MCRFDVERTILRASLTAWLARNFRQKGPFLTRPACSIGCALKALVPSGADVVFLGTGEFDGIELLQTLSECGWKYVCRTASNALLNDGEEFSFHTLLVQPGMCLIIEEVAFMRQYYGPVLAVAWWRKGHQEPLYLISNMDLREEVCYYYQKRFRIETFFSD